MKIILILKGEPVLKTIFNVTRNVSPVDLRFCILFQVMSWLFSIPLRTVNNTKTQENVSVCTGPKSSTFRNILLHVTC